MFIHKLGWVHIERSLERQEEDTAEQVWKQDMHNTRTLMNLHIFFYFSKICGFSKKFTNRLSSESSRDCCKMQIAFFIFLKKSD